MISKGTGHLIAFGKRIQNIDDAGFPEVDASGQPVFTFQIFKKAHAEVTDFYGAEKYQAKQVYNEELVKFRIPYLTGITPDYLISFRGDIYEIVEPPDNVQYRNRELRIVAKRVIL